MPHKKRNLFPGAISRDTLSQKLEDNTMIHLLIITNKVTGYFEHADGILTVKGNSITTTEDTSICAIVSFTVEGEYNKKIDFLDIKIAINQG